MNQDELNILIKEFKEFAEPLIKEALILYEQKEEDRKSLSPEDFDKKYPMEKHFRAMEESRKAWNEKATVLISPFKEDKK